MADFDPTDPEWANDSTWHAKVRRLARPITWAAAHCYHRRKSIGLLVGVLLLLGGGYAGYRVWLAPPEKELGPPPTIEAALAELDAGRYATAREIATRLERETKLSFEEESVPFFVLGAVIAHDAAEQWNQGQRKSLYLLAARYLQESQDRGFPPGRSADGVFLLGQCLFLAGRLDEAIPVLEAALDETMEANAERRALVLRLLAKAHFHHPSPNLRAARRYNRAFLAESGTLPAQRDEAVLDLARIALQQGDLTACEQALEHFHQSEPVPPEPMLVELRLELARCRQDREASLPEDAAQARPLIDRYHRLIEQLRKLAATQPPGSNVSRAATFLVGVCYREQGELFERLDKEAEARLVFGYALNQFARTRRLFFDAPEGMAAAVAESRLLQQLDRNDEAFERFHETLQDAGNLENYDNPWLPTERLVSQLVEAQRAFLDDEAFSYAVRMSEQLADLLPAGKTTLLVAEAYREWAEQLEKQARDLPVIQAEQLRADARQKWRRAGRAYRRLADLRFTTRYYTEDLWTSIDCLMKGRQYRYAIPRIKFYLTQENRKRRPRGLLGLGECHLQIGRPEESLRWLKELLELYPKHPLGYRARLVAAKAHLLLGENDAAIDVLNANLFHDALSPDSIEWRDSLFMLGELFYRRGEQLEAQSRKNGLTSVWRDLDRAPLESLRKSFVEFNAAIDKLSEAVARYPDAPQVSRGRYQLAESYRKGTRYLLLRYASETVESDRAVTRSELEKRLARAVEEYTALSALLSQRQEDGRLTDLENNILRNAYFGHADALYDLERYEEAIHAYSTVSNRYQGEPVSLEAFVQIASCYQRLGRLPDARSTLEQAKIVLGRMIRDDADFLATTRYTRTEWISLLEWLSQL